MSGYADPGFGDDALETERLEGVYLAQVVNIERNPDDEATASMEMLGRIKFVLPGIIEPESAWAFPCGSGSVLRDGEMDYWGANFVPPVGADVYVMFLNGDPDRPMWFPAYPGIPVDPDTNEAVSEAFPEFTDPRIAVFGIGPFRLVIDNRGGDNAKQATLKSVKKVNGVEEAIVEIVIDSTNNSLLVRGTRQVKIESDALIDIDAPQVQIRGRTVMPSTKPIN